MALVSCALVLLDMSKGADSQRILPPLSAERVCLFCCSWLENSTHVDSVSSDDQCPGHSPQVLPLLNLHKPFY